MTAKKKTETKKKKRETYLTPAGRFKYPHLTAPDHGTKEYPKDPPEFNVTLVLPPEEAAAFKASLMPFYEQALEEGKAKFDEKDVAKRKKNPFEPREPGIPVYDDNENETGEMEFHFKTKAVFKNRKTGETFTKKMALFDALGNPIREPIQIWGGTVGKIAFNIAPYFVDANSLCGITLYLEAVQIIDLVSDGTRSAESYGFGAEDGYVHDTGGPLKGEDADTDDTGDSEEDNGLEEDADF